MMSTKNVLLCVTQIVHRVTCALIVLVHVSLSIAAVPGQQVVDADNWYTIDTIQAAVFTPEGTHIITLSDVTRPNLAGVIRTLDEMVFEVLVYLDAKKFKALPDEHALDKYLASIQRANNLTREDLKRMFASAGYSYEEGREQLKMMQAVNSMISQRVRSGLIVPRKDVVAYYESHPETEQAQVRIEHALVPFSATQSKEAQKAALMKHIKTGIAPVTITWESPFWVKPSEVAVDKQFIFSMKAGQVCMPIETDAGFELYRIVEKKDERVKTLDERYQDIVDKLIEPQYYKMLGRYKDGLFKEASIVYF
jgi:parvulin-like peptidyl-prolyl isomerase